MKQSQADLIYLAKRGDRRFTLHARSLLRLEWSFADPSAGTELENKHVLAYPPARGGMNVGARQDE